MSKPKGHSAYSRVFEINNQYKKDFKFGQLLNMMAKRWDAWKTTIEKDVKKNQADYQIRSDQAGIADKFMLFLTWLLTVPVRNDDGTFEDVKRPRFKTIKSFLPSNPNGDRTPKEILKAIKEGVSLNDLKLWETERIALKEVDVKYGGLSVFRIVQISWGVFKILHKNPVEGKSEEHNKGRLGDAFTRGDLNEEIVKAAAEVYKEKAVERRLKSREESESVQSDSDENEPLVEDVTSEFVESETNSADIVQMLIDGDIKASDLSDVDKLETVRPELSGGLKGSVTKRINQLVEA